MTIEELVTFDTISVAQNLIGCCLSLKNPSNGKTLASGRIVETEAYLEDDPASHSYKGLCPRNASMFRTPGHLYVYLIYGVHHCLNIVTGPEGRGEAVLLRALEPLTGIDLMGQRRFGDAWESSNTELMKKNLCSGPGKICQAMGITRDGMDGMSINKGKLHLTRGSLLPDESVAAGPRIGLSPGRGNLSPYRFTIKGNPYLSR